MKRLVLIAASFALTLPASLTVHAEDKLGAGITMYFQMGGNPGDGATLPRTNGARAAAAALGVNLKEQYSAWQPANPPTMRRTSTRRRRSWPRAARG